MKTLENLFYGNISPHERYIKQGSEVEKLVKLVFQTEDELNATLTEKQKEMFGNIRIAQMNYRAFASRKHLAPASS